MNELTRLSSKPREDHFVVLDVSQDVIRAGLGIHETLRRPSVEIAARVGLRSPRSSPTPSVADYLVGPALEEAERSGESLDIVWPLSIGLFCDDDSSKGKEKELDGVIDWTGFEALLSYVLFSALGLPARPIAYHLQLGLPASISLATHELITQLIFERLHMPALILSERPVLSLYGLNSTSGIVVDIGRHTTEIGIVFDSVYMAGAATRSRVGSVDLDNYLCHLILSAQPSLPRTLSPSAPLSPADLHAALLSMVRVLRDGGHLHFASAVLSLNVAADGSRLEDESAEGDGEALDDVAKALISGKAASIIGKTSAPLQASVTSSGESVTMPNPLGASLPAITIGPERHRFAEPLFDPSVLRAVAGFGVTYSQLDLDRRAGSVPDAISAAVRCLEPRQRPALWDCIVVTGSGSAKGVPTAMLQAIQGYVPASAPAKPKLAKIADYFPEFKERLDLASFLGASIVAKIGFTDQSGSFWINKSDYSAGGPTIVSHIDKPQAI